MPARHHPAKQAWRGVKLASNPGDTSVLSAKVSTARAPDSNARHPGRASRQTSSGWAVVVRPKEGVGGSATSGRWAAQTAFASVVLPRARTHLKPATPAAENRDPRRPCPGSPGCM
ncbi:hypothetical protein PtA15_13A494 [Puccinia triticina]|uniref:Uncharacterized protein n=1 Tax=Puccinia triticina TaxID=208348 RepID=A0ABY7D3D8_9BASI|nr:uncharacterized protein PtA15_13A494 [Puccinia triticina]WAQ91093.1 hypothetical protein PtA15_13A494 [Puccinia triticina]